MLRPEVLLVLGLSMAGTAHASSHYVTVQNDASETIRRIEITATAAPSENRLVSQLPPRAVARIRYSAGCPANVHLVFESGRIEDHPGVDACSDPRVVAGQDGVAHLPRAASSEPSRKSGIVQPKPAATAVATGLPAKALPPPVPPWTGKSITKRFGGMD